jgi:hypothetical protein
MIDVDGKLTLTAGELRERLNDYPPDTPVFATWEGVMASFKPENMVLEKYSLVDCVVIDVENYYRD